MPYIKEFKDDIENYHVGVKTYTINWWIRLDEDIVLNNGYCTNRAPMYYKCREKQKAEAIIKSLEAQKDTFDISMICYLETNEIIYKSKTEDKQDYKSVNYDVYK